VLYLRLVIRPDAPVLGEESTDGLIELRDQSTGDLLGMTIVNWWKRVGQGPFPDSIREIEGGIEPWANKRTPTHAQWM
jgi:hypothetical protein